MCLVGGWWPYKDTDVVDAALARLDVPVHVLAVGGPATHTLLKTWAALPHVRLHTRPGPVPETVVSQAYAAADAALVARRSGVAKESGLVVDAVRLGVPLIVSLPLRRRRRGRSPLPRPGKVRADADAGLRADSHGAADG